ncbi:MAG: hypothetical protein PHF79_01385 [Candidatus Pacebacteria bacterium]|nr:hypothetical protein [Candidatus Paceibacterota bacterium]
MKDFGLTKREFNILNKLSTPEKIQDFLETLAYNFEKKGETYMSPRRVLSEKKAHCLEGALLAGLALWIHGKKPLLLDLKTTPSDGDHIIALYRQNGYWGAISKTNHACLRFRDPIYRNIRELVASYFHEYFLNKNGEKTLRSYSRPFDLRQLGTDWITTDKDLWDIAYTLDEITHHPLFPKSQEKFIRKADKFERRAGTLTEWQP